MASNPFKDTQEAVRRSGERSGLDVAQVVGVDPDSHQVAIRPATTTESATDTSPDVATVSIAKGGDIALPSEGDMVLVAWLKNRTPIVLGTYYTRTTQLREYSPDERHLGLDGGGGVFMHGPFGVVPLKTTDPANPPDGSVWYREDLDEYRGVEGGTKVSFDTTTV